MTRARLRIGAAALVLLASTTARAEDPPATSPPPAAGEGGSLVAAGVAFGLAGVGLIAGVTTGILSLSAINGVEASCKNGLCPASEHDKAQSAKVLGNASTASLIVGGAAALTGVTFLVVLPRGRAASASPGVTYRVGLGLGRLMIEARF